MTCLLEQAVSFKPPEGGAAASADAHLRGLRQLLVALGNALSAHIGEEDLV